jgi:hypothetical protein
MRSSASAALSLVTMASRSVAERLGIGQALLATYRVRSPSFLTTETFKPRLSAIFSAAIAANFQPASTTSLSVAPFGRRKSFSNFSCNTFGLPLVDFFAVDFADFFVAFAI